MDNAKLKTLLRIAECLQGAQNLFCLVKSERYPLIQWILTRFGYNDMNPKEKGDSSAVLERITGMSRQQITRIAGTFQDTEEIRLGTSRPEGDFIGSSGCRVCPF